MKSKFFEYYLKQESDFDSLWNDAEFVFDSNILLGLYSYPDSSRKKILRLLNKMSERLWIPNQVGIEFHRHRIDVIHKNNEKCEELKEKITDLSNYLSRELNQHPFVSVIGVGDKLNEIKAILEDDKSTSKIDFDDDPLLKSITDLFDGKVGDPFNQDEFAQTVRDGEKRYPQRIPPGYMDRNKDKSDQSGLRKYGDLIIWKQMINRVKSTNKPILFIGNDLKEDWWVKIRYKNGNEKIIGPRPELLKEMKDETGHNFHIYQMERFIELAGKKLKVRFEKKDIQDIKESAELDIMKSDTGVGSTSTPNISEGFSIPMSIPLGTQQAGMEVGIASPSESSNSNEGNTQNR